MYEFLKQENIGSTIMESADIFFPCSDKYNLEIFKYIKPFLHSYQDSFSDINCCGLGGGVLFKNKDIGNEIKSQILAKEKSCIYTYCSSCSHAFDKYGIENIKNILSEILGACEEPSSNTLKNSLYFKFKDSRR